LASIVKNSDEYLLVGGYTKARLQQNGVRLVRLVPFVRRDISLKLGYTPSEISVAEALRKKEREKQRKRY